MNNIYPPVYLTMTIILMVVLHYLFPVIHVFAAPWSFSGIIPLVAGLIIIIWSARLFNQAQTAIIPFKESSQLVTGGMYRFTRNPMYLGMVFILLGIALLLGSLTPFIPIPLFAWLITSLFISKEEDMLEERFGEEYLEFRTRVRRWI